MTGVFVRRKAMWKGRCGRLSCDSGGRDWSCEVTSQGMTKIADDPETKRKVSNRLSPRAFERAWPCLT